MPGLAALYRLAKEKGLVLIGVDQTIRAALRKVGVDIP
jgi:hypothetical protein